MVDTSSQPGEIGGLRLLVDVDEVLRVMSGLAARSSLFRDNNASMQKDPFDSWILVSMFKGLLCGYSE